MSNQKDIRKNVLLVWVLPPKERLYSLEFQCSGRRNRPSAKVFTCGENACAAHSRRRPEGRVGAVLSACREFENIQIVVTSQKETPADQAGVFLFSGTTLEGEGKRPSGKVTASAGAAGTGAPAPPG